MGQIMLTCSAILPVLCFIAALAIARLVLMDAHVAKERKAGDESTPQSV